MADAQRQPDVLRVHDRFAEHRQRRDGWLGRAREDGPEPVDGLGRGRAQLLGQPHGHLPVEIEPAADHAGQPAERIEAGPRGEVREHLAHCQTGAQRRCRPLLAGQVREIGRQGRPLGVDKRPDAGWAAEGCLRFQFGHVSRSPDHRPVRT